MEPGDCMAFVEFRNVGKRYKMGEVSIEALHDVSFTVEKGEICVIVGASGAGKTTLLNILGGMYSLTSGSVRLNGKKISNYSSKRLTQYRRRDIGFVFQFYNLVPSLTALENVELAAQICPHPRDAARTLRDVGLEKRMDNFPAQLSGGEQQRVAIARAIAHRPKVLFADEPTGALDTNTGLSVVKLFQELTQQEGVTIVMTTHDTGLMELGDKVNELEGGELVHGQ